DAAVVRNLELRKHFELSFEVEILAVVEVEIAHVRAAHGAQLLGGDPVINRFGDQVLDYFLPDIRVVMLTNQRHRRFAGTKTLEMDSPSEFLGHLFGFLLNLRNRNGDFKLVLTA